VPEHHPDRCQEQQTAHGGEAGRDTEQQADGHGELGEGQEDPEESPVRYHHVPVERAQRHDLPFRCRVGSDPLGGIAGDEVEGEEAQVETSAAEDFGQRIAHPDQAHEDPALRTPGPSCDSCPRLASALMSGWWPWLSAPRRENFPVPHGRYTRADAAVVRARAVCAVLTGGRPPRPGQRPVRRAPRCRGPSQSRRRPRPWCW